MCINFIIVEFLFLQNNADKSQDCLKKHDTIKDTSETIVYIITTHTFE